MTLNINKFNPIGYNAQTPDGQNYKKSNIGKSVALVGMAGVEFLLNKSKYGKLFSLENTLKNDFNINVPKKYSKPLQIFGIVVDLAFAYGIGVWIDKQINKHRINKLSQNINK